MAFVARPRVGKASAWPALRLDRSRHLLPTIGRRALGVGLALELPLAVLAVWQLAAQRTWVAPQILPEPAIVWQTAMDLMADGQLQSELLVSLGRLSTGLIAGGTAGLAVGLAMGLSPGFDAYLGPTVRLLWSVPALGWLPFLMLVFGIGETLKIVLIAKTCFLPLMLNSYGGVRAMPAKYRDVARTLELSHAQTLRHVVLPAVLPAILNGFRLSVAKGWQTLVLVEMIASAAGIGYLMTWGRKSFQLDVVLVTMVVIGIAGYTLDLGAEWVQRRFAGWSTRTAC